MSAPVEGLYTAKGKNFAASQSPGVIVLELAGCKWVASPDALKVEIPVEVWEQIRGIMPYKLGAITPSGSGSQ